MEQIYVQVGFRRLKGTIIGEENGKYIVELQDNSRVIVDKNQVDLKEGK